VRKIFGKGFQKGITLRHLRALVALSDLKLIARVSKALGVTQPAVSKQIVELEKIVGVPIVTRDRNRLYLTPIGIRLANHARQALGQIDRAAFEIEAMVSGVSGSVSIGVVSSVAPTLLPGAIALFKRSTPHANVSVSEGHFVELLPQLEAGMLDLVIARIWQPRELAGIDQMALFSEPVVVVAGRKHPLAHAGELTWADVVSYPWILPQPNSVARQAIDALFALNALTPPNNTIASLSQALNLELLRVMPAIGLLPQRLAQEQAALGRTVILPLETQDLLSEARCFWRKDQASQNPALSLFLKCLQESTEDIKTIPFD
jgi:DNA-binding transcriptional LysR family regulator